MDYPPVPRFSTTAASPLPKQSFSVRCTNLLAQPISEFDHHPHNPTPASSPHESFEFDESDVIWGAPDLSINSPPTVSHFPPMPHPHPRLSPHHNPRILLYKSGLSAALSDEQRSLVRRKSNLNPSISARLVMHARHEGRMRFPQSAPVNVPIWPKKTCHLEDPENPEGNEDKDEEEDEEKKGEMIPPHEIVARSHSNTFSVFEGAGRTLKGRDLCRVRTAVFRQTGFID